MEVKRQLDVLDRCLAEREYIAGDAYTIADMAIFPCMSGTTPAISRGRRRTNSPLLAEEPLCGATAPSCPSTIVRFYRRLFVTKHVAKTTHPASRCRSAPRIFPRGEFAI
jgi:hypothetical protein